MRASRRFVLASLSAASLAAVGCGGDDREGAPAPIEPLSETSAALTFKANPYDYNLAPPVGSSYTDLIPKTLDLADMAALTLQTMTLDVDPAADYKFWFIADWSVNPPHLRHENEFWQRDDFQGDIASQGKFLAPLVWNRLVSGSSFNLTNHRHIIDQLFLDVNKTLGMQGSGVRAYEGFIVNYLRDGNAMWKTFVLQAVQDWIQSLVDSGDQGEEAYWGDSPPGKDIDRQDPWREEIMLLAYKYLGYAPALQAVRKHVNYVRRSSGMFAENGSFDDTHDDGPHFHIHALHLQAFLNLALAVQDQDLLDFVNRAYLWAQRRDVGSISLIGYFPELVRIEKNGEGCSLSDMVTLAIDLSKTGQFDYWDDADRWVRNHFAEAQLTTTKGSQLQAFAQGLPYEPGSVEPTDYAGPQVTARSIGGFAGWPTPNDFRQQDQRGIQQCCTGNGSRAVFHVWDNIITDEGGIFRVNLLLNRASPRADIYSHIPYVGKVEIKMKQATPDVRIRIPNWVSNSGLALAVNGTSRAFAWDGRYMKVGSVAAGDRIVVTLALSESTASETMAGIRYTFTRRGSTIVGVTPRGTIAPLYDRASMRSSPAPMVSVKRFLSNEADISNRRDPTWKLPVVAVTASSSEAGFPPDLMLDGSQDEDSRWDSRGDGQFAVFDLGRPYSVKYVAAAFYQGDERVARFEVQVSADGRSYTPVFYGQSGSQTNKLTGFNCDGAPPARFVKLIGHGNSQNEFNEITELEIFGNTSDGPADLAAQVSATAQIGSNGPAHARDNNLNTRWAAGETESIKLDLGAVKSVVSVDIAFYLATSRTYRFDIETSTDNEHWTLVSTGNSSRSTLQRQPFDIPNMAARYIRVTGQGSSADGSIGITEIKVDGY